MSKTRISLGALGCLLAISGSAAAAQLVAKGNCSFVENVPGIIGSSHLNKTVLKGAVFTQQSDGRFCGMSTMDTPFGPGTISECFVVADGQLVSASYGNKVSPSDCVLVDPSKIVVAADSSQGPASAGTGAASSHVAVPAPAKASPVKAEPTRPATNWTVKSSVSQLTGAKFYSAGLSSTNEIPNSIGRPETAEMIVRCQDSKLEAYVVWPPFMGSDSRVAQYKFDEGPIWKQMWKPSSDGTATFIPQVEIFLGKLANAKKFVVDVEPYQQSTAEAVFDTNGADKVVADALAACGGN